MDELMPRKIQRYGWKRGLPDHRCLKYAEHFAGHAFMLPASVDLRPYDNSVYDQKSLGSCHDGLTEVLTDRGWKLFAYISYEDKLASVDPVSKTLIFENPTRIIRHHHKGEMYYGKCQAMDFCVTPDHEMVVSKWNESTRKLEERYQFIPMDKVGWYAGCISQVKYNGEINSSTYTINGVDHRQKSQRIDTLVPMESWLKFLGIYLAEGTILNDKKHYKIQLAASKDRERDYIQGVLNTLELKSPRIKDRFTFDNKRIYKCLESMGLKGVKSYDKFVPEFVFKLPGHQIKAFLEGHFMGDGSKQRGHISHYTSSRRLADDLQRLIFLSGNIASVTERSPRTSIMKDGRIVRGKHPEFRIGISTRNSSIDKKQYIRKEHYDGEVFCAEVPSYHTLVTRRNGKILISGNCTSNSIAGMCEYVTKHLNKSWLYVGSRLFIYYNERVIEGDTKEDSGASLSDGMRVIHKLGVPNEKNWPYDISKFAVKPPASVYANGLQHKAGIGFQIDNTKIVEIKNCLSGGFPFVFGFTVYESFESSAVAKSGIVPMPGKKEEQLGGHAVMCVGYDDDKQWLIVRNSWGPDWGANGYFFIPYAYITNRDMADEFFTIREIS